jgi:hypothetical protein
MRDTEKDRQRKTHIERQRDTQRQGQRETEGQREMVKDTEREREEAERQRQRNINTYPCMDKHTYKKHYLLKPTQEELKSKIWKSEKANT